MEGTLLPDDVVREILQRVPTDAAALFRCAAICKQWRAVLADLSFLRHHWPENACHPSSFLGFFNKSHDDQEPPVFFPVLPGSVFGARHRSLASFVSGIPDDILNDAVPLAARGGLLLVYLAVGGLPSDSLHLAVCDIFTGTCDVLPQLDCRVSRFTCLLLDREDCYSLHGQQQGRRTPLTMGYFFKVVAMVIHDDDDDCDLYTFLSSEPNWSEPRKCFDQVWLRDAFHPRILLNMNNVIVCRGMAYWLGSYSAEQWGLPSYFTFAVNVNTSQISITELSIPANQLAAISHFGLMLSVAVDGKLSLFHLHQDGLQLNKWTQGDDGAWLRTRVVELKPPKSAAWEPIKVSMLSGEKSGSLFMSDLSGHVHKTDPETGVMEDVTTEMFQDSLIRYQGSAHRDGLAILVHVTPSEKIIAKPEMYFTSFLN